jgi:DNA-binding GntR family transcriptional regulator
MSLASTNLVEPRPALFDPLPRRTIGDDVLDTLRKSIIAGAFASGDHLAEGALAQQFGVSRAPVREAMMQLEREGLLVFNKRGAALVKEFTAADFEEIFSLRLTLETMAARLACRTWDQTASDRLESNIERTRTATRLLDVTLLDVEFHDLVVQAARHQRLYSSWSNLRHQIEVWLARMQSRLDAPVQKTREATVQHHRGILRALRSGREERALRAAREHIEGWRRQFPNANPQRPASRGRNANQ